MATKGIYLPVEVLRDHTLTMQEKLILMEIDQLANLENRSCYAGNQHFAEMLDISKKSASNTISALKTKGRITVDLSHRNHKRLLSIKDGQVSIKDGQPSIKDGESKDTITKKKTISEYDQFLEAIKKRVKIKSKVTKTKDGEKLYKQLHDPKVLADAYVKHQEEKGDYAVRITKFMEDEEYNTQAKPEAGETDLWM